MSDGRRYSLARLLERKGRYGLLRRATAEQQEHYIALLRDMLVHTYGDAREVVDDPDFPPGSVHISSTPPETAPRNPSAEREHVQRTAEEVFDRWAKRHRLH